jgi:hypothetical protein
MCGKGYAFPIPSKIEGATPPIITKGNFNCLRGNYKGGGNDKY